MNEPKPPQFLSKETENAYRAALERFMDDKMTVMLLGGYYPIESFQTLRIRESEDKETIKLLLNYLCL